MRNVVLALCVLGLTVAAAADKSDRKAVNPQGTPVLHLEPASTFEEIENERQRSLAFFLEAGKVITHPRCVNCHPAGDSPLQGEHGEPHQPFVVRGADDHGAPGMRCQTCHGEENFDPGNVPGHDPWHLAPIETAWEGKTLGEICRQLKDPERNGDRTLDEIVDHMANDGLVGWGWHPGGDRQPAPGDQKTFGGLIRAWVDSGAVCPGDGVEANLAASEGG